MKTLISTIAICLFASTAMAGSYQNNSTSQSSSNFNAQNGIGNVNATTTSQNNRQGNHAHSDPCCRGSYTAQVNAAKQAAKNASLQNGIHNVNITNTHQNSGQSNVGR